MAEPTRMTLATPIMMPSSVRKVRSLWARSESQASPMAFRELVREDPAYIPESYGRGRARILVDDTGRRPVVRESTSEHANRLLRPLLIVEFLIASGDLHDLERGGRAVSSGSDVLAVEIGLGVAAAWLISRSPATSVQNDGAITRLRDGVLFPALSRRGVAGVVTWYYHLNEPAGSAG